LNKPQAHERVIVALDMPELDAALRLAERLAPHIGAVTVGLELFNAAGPKAIGALVETGAKVFYDAKLHDIPNTVAGAVRAAVRQRLWMINVHTTGGSAMMEAAVEAARSQGAAGAPKVIGVTLLTSLGADLLRDEFGIADPRAYVERLAKLALRSGLDGVVASPLEAEAIRQACGDSFLIVTPGVRPAGSDVGDQRRAATPADAVAAGADYLVIGRPITGAKDPVEAAQRIAEELA
jgi:orotidine-5'-phosphate decarboxylase